MNLLTLVPLFGTVLNLLLSVFMISRGWRARLHQVFFSCGLCITIWNLGTFALFQRMEAETAYAWARFLQYGVIFIPVLLLHLSLLVADERRPKILATLYAVAVGLAFSNATGYFITGVRWVGYAYYSVAGPGFWVFTLTFSATIYSIVMLLRKRRTLTFLVRRRLDGLIVAQSTLALLGGNDMLPILGVDTYPLTQFSIFPYGSLAAGFYGIIVGYSVLQHHLLDIHIVLDRTAAHVVRFFFLAAIGVGLQLVVAVFAPEPISLYSFFGSLLVLIVSAAITSIYFPRLVGQGAERIERRLLGDHFEYQDQVRNFIERMSWHDDLPRLLEELHGLFLRTFRLESYWIILRDETNLTFNIARAHPADATPQRVDLKPSSPVFEFFEWGKGRHLSLSHHYLRLNPSALEREARVQLEQFPAEFCFPLAWQREPFGLLLIGPKANQDPFTATDITLLADLAKAMSIVANQIQLKNKVLQVQQLELLGSMSRGMAHDLNNLLTPVSTLLQLAQETGGCDEELLPTALRNISTMRSYIKESLFFSEHQKPDLRLARLDITVQQTVELARSTRKKPVEIDADIQGEAYAEVNEVLVQRLLTNIISNAIDASEPGSLIRVRLQRLLTSDTAREWFRLEVIDQGEGISREDLDRVQIPYFTTKNRGDETRGFGLGLAICRKIVTLHGGRLSIESQLRQGTTVQVDLPSRQLNAEPSSPLALHTSA